MKKYVFCLLLSLPITLVAQTNAKKIFDERCAPCHGNQGDERFLFLYKRLQNSAMSDSLLRQTIKNGRRMMPSFGKKLNADEIDALIEYIKVFRRR